MSRQQTVDSARFARDVPKALLGWYDRHRRDLPWRAATGEMPDPYAIWLSEVMLQQTTVAAVKSYYEAFLARWPTVEALAAAPLDDVLKAWAGLGYYSRARNLHRCAQHVAEELAGRFPTSEAGLAELPGIGPYTAAAIAAIAFDQPATVVDGNVERVVARLFAVRTPLPAAKPELRALAATLTPGARPGDFAQAMMDLGAVLCTPRQPNCLICPLRQGCRAQAEGIAAQLPARTPRGKRPTRYGAAFVVVSDGDLVLLRRRPERGLLGGMSEVPTTDWTSQAERDDEALREAPCSGPWTRAGPLVTHVFTHFRLELTVFRVHLAGRPALRDAADPARCRWVPRTALSGEALPTVMRKVLAAALGEDVTGKRSG